MASSAYLNVRNAIAGDAGSDARVEVNQRALIDKILARYASAGAVYRELLQNSNDADATIAEILITTSSSSSSEGQKEVVSEVIYRNNGMPFRTQDWARLRKIAEGNPDASKVGAFGVGAYTMFSICEEPLVVSGKKGEEEAMAFFWKGDSLWTKTGKAPDGIVNMSATLNASVQDDNSWTSFILPSRDPYPLPDLVEFGQFLTASLTFTQCLNNIRVYVNSTLQLNIQKTIIESHTIVTPKASSWWKNDGAVTSSSSGMFTLGKGADLTQTSVQMSVSLRKDVSPNSEMETSQVRARYASALVNTKIPSEIEKRMVRVTKKKPPKELTVQIFLDAADHSENHQQQASKLKRKAKQSKAALITQSFAPTSGSGRIFIGFRTSQTTGLGIHLAAPLMPTVEREAIDFVDPALREFNSELLEVSGILMRLALEHEMLRLGEKFNWKEEREAWEAQREERKKQKKEEEEEKKSETDDAESTKDSADDKSSITQSLYSFASFMARGVKNSVVEAVKAVPELLGEDSETTELLNPIDDRPLNCSERDAIILMKAYCPRQSTPDSLVGQCLAKGFGRCMASSSPPVLTVDGVARGIDSRLPQYGLEAFGVPNAVRRILLENAKEYHTVIANCPTMTIDDLIKAMKENILSEEMLIRLLKWYPKYARLSNPRRDKSLQLKEAIRYHKDSKGSQSNDNEAEVHKLDSIFYFAPHRMNKQLPLPETVFSQSMVASIGLRTLEDRHFNDWFEPLPFDIWTVFISEHMRNGDEKDDEMRVLILVTLSKHFDSLETETAKRRFVELLPLTSPCLPFDTTSSEDKLSASIARTAIPNELYLPDADLSAFSGVGTFYKASKRLKKEGVSNQFLLAMGVRKTIKIDFLFLHLDTLNWNENPKPLIKYLIDADLSQQDLLKLRSTRYLPAANDKTTVYAPSQLYLQDSDLNNVFPFVKFLQWPSNEGMSSADRNFLLKLGVRIEPPISDIMQYLEKESAKSVDARDDAALSAALQYLSQRLGPKGAYANQFHYTKVNFLPCIRQNLETGEVVKEIKSPSTCYYNPSAMVMGFCVLDPMLDTEQIGVRMKCNRDPSPQVLLRRLLQLVDMSKAKVNHLERQGTGIEAKEKNIEKILEVFDGVFLYLSSRTSDFQKRHLSELANKPFIPCKCRSGLQFYTADQVFFQKRKSEGGVADDSIAELLFQQVEYNAFLSFAGVKTEPSLEELFALMMEKPDEVLDSLGEPKYKTLLRRIAANPPFKRITAEIRSAPFLLGYLIVDEDESEGDETKARSKAQFLLAKADDIHIVDNAFLRRQFPMLISPMEQTLEEFYRRIGSKYVSEVVKKDFEVLGNTHRGTPLANSCADRIKERRPLLLSPSITSRPLVSNASSILDNLEIFQADSIRAIYSFERSSKMIHVTCCSKLTNRKNIAIFITKNFEMFDVGSCIGDLILQHCELKDAFFLTSLLEASIGTLRNRGFPVDRIVKPPVVEAKAEPRKQTPASSETSRENSFRSSSNDVANHASVEAAHAKNPTQASSRDNQDDGGFDTILKSMYPQHELSKIREMLGPNPTKEKAAAVAYDLSEELDKDVAGSEHEGTKGTVNEAGSIPSPKKEKKSVLGKIREGLGGKMPPKLNKRLGGSFPPQGQGVCDGVGGGVGADDQGNMARVGRGVGVSQGDDGESKGREDAVQKSLEAMLQQSIQSSRSVNSSGVASEETLLQNLPEGIDCRSNGCEVVPAQNIRPFKGPHGNYNSRNGIRVMAAVSSTSTANEAFGFLSDNFDAVENFSVVIGHLVQIFKLKLGSVAIYYDPNGSTIAFNSNKAFHFNLRFFHAIHRHDWNSKVCYSYWYTVFCHELAHNLVSAHNKEHGKYTESIVMLYLPALIDFLAQNGIA